MSLMIGIAALLIPEVAHANVMLPGMIFVYSFALPQTWLFFLPIIFIEAAVLMFRLPISAWQSMKVSFIANVVSTIVGLIIFAFLEFGISFVLNLPDIPEKFLYLLDYAFFGMEFFIWLLCFLLSIFIELEIAQRMLSLPRKKLWSSLIIGNCITYGLLLFILLMFMR